MSRKHRRKVRHIHANDDEYIHVHRDNNGDGFGEVIGCLFLVGLVIIIIYWKVILATIFISLLITSFTHIVLEIKGGFFLPVEKIYKMGKKKYVWCWILYYAVFGTFLYLKSCNINFFLTQAVFITNGWIWGLTMWKKLQKNKNIE